MTRLVFLPLLFGLAICTSASAHAREPDPQGKPDNFEPGKPAAYFVWHDRDGWHLRTTTARKLHRFRGTIEVDSGEITELLNHNSEARGPDWARRSRDKKKVTFDLKTDGQADGLNFKVSDNAETVTFSLNVDEGGAPTKRIFVGAQGRPPEASEFTLPAHPGRGG
jgi:hypothetical protein